METQKDIEINIQPKHLLLTQDQSLFISKILPKSYVILPTNKSNKQSITQNSRNKSTKRIEYEEDVGEASKSQKDFDKSIQPVRKQRNKPEINISKQEKIIKKIVKITEESVAPELRHCFRFLQSLKKHPSSWPFLQAVDPIALGIPTYFDKIKQPMDFGTIESNLGTGNYQTQTQFHADIGKVFMNSYRFNSKGSDVYQLTQEVELFYNKLVDNPNQSVPEKSKLTFAEQIKKPQVPKRPIISKRQADIEFSNGNKKRKPTQQVVQVNAMTVTQKKLLGQNIRRLPRDALKGVWAIVCNGNTANEELKFDLDKLPADTARELQRYVNSQFSQNYKGEFNIKESIQTSATFKEKFQQSEDPQSFIVSQESH